LVLGGWTVGRTPSNRAARLLLQWALFTTLVLLSRGASAGVQMLPAWVRLTPTSVMQPNYTDIYVAKGEVESFQLGVWGPIESRVIE